MKNMETIIYSGEDVVYEGNPTRDLNELEKTYKETQKSWSNEDENSLVKYKSICNSCNNTLSIIGNTYKSAEYLIPIYVQCSKCKKWIKFIIPV